MYVEILQKSLSIFRGAKHGIPGYGNVKCVGKPPF